MAVKTITITELAYLRLRRLKRPEESFSDLVVRLTEDRKSVMHLAGSWKDMPRKDYEELVKALHEEEAISERKVHRRIAAMLEQENP
jgi:predicted CopG family antitoxin